ncbi:hypothetical protein FACS1894166_05210 [Bacilli bacterium]|nr:hypothetical protein FACS1894166_05210 [Bacilli bacterium]
MNMIDDSRTFYDICHIINDEQNEKVDPKVNPDDSELGISSIKNIYSQFTNKFNPNTIYLNSDSQQVLYPFANPKNPNDPNTLAQSNAAIFYSGDCLYAAMGSGIDAWSDT